jgi:hypothetical protein
MASSWQPIHRAVKLLNVGREDLYRMRDSGDLKLGKHYGAGPMTRSRDSYYWNVPLMQKTIKQQQESQKTSVA